MPTTYYIAKTGDNGNTGTSPGNEWATHAYAATQISPGDTVLIRGGTYTEYISNVYASGAGVGSETTIKNYPDETVVIAPTADRCLYVYEKSHLIFDGMDCNGSNVTYNAVKFESSAVTTITNLTFKNGVVRSAAETGLLVAVGAADGDNISIIDTIMHSNGGSSDFNHGLYLQTSDSLVSGCTAYSNAGWGLHVYHSGGGNDNVTLSNCKTYSNGTSTTRGSGVVFYTGTGHLCYNLISYDNLESGIQIACGSSEFYNITAEGNTTYGLRIDSGSSNIVKNLYALNNSTANLSDLGTSTTKSNNKTSGNIWADSTNHDYTLTQSSPGADLSGIFTTDYAGVTRSAWDVGAYEYVASGVTKSSKSISSRIFLPTFQFRM